MSDWELVDVSGDGTSQFARFDSMTGNLLEIKITNDVEDIIESNKVLRNDGTGGYGPTREWKRVASIPISLIHQWEREMGMERDFLFTREGFPALIKKAKDPDYSHLRTDK
jgi:hypothetical protein